MVADWQALYGSINFAEKARARCALSVARGSAFT